jgi:hypothetical protein
LLSNRGGRFVPAVRPAVLQAKAFRAAFRRGFSDSE